MLATVDLRRLIGRLVLYSKRDASVLQFGIGMFAGCRQEHHHRAFDCVRVGSLPAVAAILANRGNRELAIAL